MSVRSTDMQIIVQKSAEMAMKQQHENAKTRLQQQQFAQQLDSKVKAENKQVNSSPETHKSLVSKEKKHNKKNKEREQPSKKDKLAKSDKDAKNTDCPDSYIDIKI